MNKRHTSEEAYYDRLRVLGNVNKKLVKESKEVSLGSLVDFKKGDDGIYYGIVKENHNFYIKKAVKKDMPDVTDFTYIGGLGNIKDYQYKTYALADKQRNMLFQSLNEIYNNGKQNLITESEVKEDAEEEIEQATSKLDDLDTATDAAAEVSVEEPITEPEVGDAVSGEEEIAVEEPESEVTDDVNGDDEELPIEGETDVDGADEEGAIDDVNLEIKDIEKNLGKLTNKIRNNELTSSQTKSFVNSFLSAFKDKFPELDIEDRKVMANKILKTVSDKEIEDIDIEDEEGVEENFEKCSECGGFTQYAESRGYTKESIMECDADEMGNLVSGYANAHNDGMNDGDFETVALFINPEISDKLKTDYGHDEYAEKLNPYVDSLTESSDEDKQTKINELNWSNALKSVGNVIGDKAKQAGEKVGNVVKAGAEKLGQGVKNVAQKTGQAVQNAGEKVAGVVSAKLDAAKNTVKSIGDEISKNYNAREQNAAVAKLEELATELGLTITKYNTAATKAGGEPVKPESIIMTIRNTIGKGGDLSKLKNPAIAEENDIANVNADQNNQIAADSDNLGVVAESESKSVETIDEISPELIKNAKKTAVNKFYNEKDPQKKEKYGQQAAIFRDKDVENSDNGNNDDLNENQKKLRNYIRTRIEEMKGLKKPSLNEDKKSETLKKLDKLIEKQLKIHESMKK